MHDKEQPLEKKSQPRPGKPSRPPLPKPPPLRVLKDGDETPRERRPTRVD
jgi:hypothetical protein